MDIQPKGIVQTPIEPTPVVAEVDVLVCGGGVAGIAAAVAAARAGARTLLVEGSGVLGGTATGTMMALLVIPFDELVGFPREFFAKLAAEHAASPGQVVPWDVEGYKLLAMETVVESGARILLYSRVSQPLMKDRRIEGVVVDGKSGRQAILAGVVIDSTGDGDVAASAGVPFVTGRECDGAMRPMTVMGRFGNIDLVKLKQWTESHPHDVAPDPGRNIIDLASGVVRVDGFFSVVAESKRRGLLDENSPVNYLRFSGLVPAERVEHADLIFNSTRVYGVDGANVWDLTRAQLEGMRQLRDLSRVCRTLIPGFEKSYLIESSAQIGVRETRHIQGRYVLQYEDIRDHNHFDDSAAVMTSLDYGAAEIHGPDSGHEGSPQDRWARQLELPLTRFEFPVRCLVPAGASGLLTAGRCVSVSHSADRFTRNMAPMSLTGQAAGTLGAIMALKRDSDWADLPVNELQARLSGDGVPVNLRGEPSWQTKR